jgi:GTPase Era involved in 16S rRNA processing
MTVREGDDVSRTPPTGVAEAKAGPRTALLLGQVERLEQALARGGDRVPDVTARAVRAALDAVRERLALGVDHTVVALVGGTGSGKSSLFNALTGLTFADVGVSRPTTSQVTACVWAHDASAVLDWLGVSRDRRMERESVLDGESQADLRGLILLDLPDHDSVEPEHRAVVDRLLPLVDLLVWVVDPQKYADDALHSGYLRHLVGHENAMLVVLNQIDTVPVDAQAALLRDVSRLLEEDGLVDVGVHSVSARTGAGIPVVRRVLAQAVSSRGVAELRAAAEVHDAASMLAVAVGTTEPVPDELPREAAVEGLARAAGVVLASGAAGARAGALEHRRAGTQTGRAGLVRERWLADVVPSLPAPWREALDATLPGADVLATAADEALGTVSVATRPSMGARVLTALSALVGLGGLLGVGVTVGSALADDAWTQQTSALAATSAGLGIVALLLLLGARGARSALLSRRATERAAGYRAALSQVVDRLLVAPTVDLLADHREVREAAREAAESTGHASDGSRTG